MAYCFRKRIVFGSTSYSRRRAPARRRCRRLECLHPITGRCDVRDRRRRPAALGALRSLASAFSLLLRVVRSRRYRLRPSGEGGASDDPTLSFLPFYRWPLPSVVGLARSRARIRAEVCCTPRLARCGLVVRCNLAWRRELAPASARVGTRALGAPCPHICFARQIISIVVTTLM